MIESINHFSVFETIRSAWHKVKGAKLGFFLISLLVAACVTLEIAMQALNDSNNHIALSTLS